MQGDNVDKTDRTIGMPVQPSGSHYLSTGEVVDGAYTVVAFIGSGAFGEVYRVHHTTLQRDFALKMLKGLGVTEADKSRFVQEVQVMAKLEHPNIVKIYNSGVYKNKFPYYVMDLITGQSLSDLIDAKEGVNALTAVTIFATVADALKAAHGRNIVHRDIKPANIILADGEGSLASRVRVVDFGVAKLLGRNSPAHQALTSVGQVFGSPLYMSPEQCTAASIDNRSDIYSLGCALYETLTGVVPFKGSTVLDTFQMHCSQLPVSLKQKSPGREFLPELEEICQQLLAKSPEERFQNMEQVKNSLLLIADLLQKPRAGTAGGGVNMGRVAVITSLSIVLLGASVYCVLALLDKTTSQKAADKPLPQANKPEELGGYDSVVQKANFKDLRSKSDFIGFDASGISKNGSNLFLEGVPTGPHSKSAEAAVSAANAILMPVKENQFFKSVTPEGDREYFLPGDSEHSIGRFSALSSHKALSAPAYGHFVIGAKQQFIFRPAPAVGKNPSILFGFRAQDISGIDLGDLETKDCAPVLKAAIARFYNLTNIVVMDNKVDANLVSIINTAEHLDRLSINAKGLDSNTITGLKNLSIMRAFELANFDGDTSTLMDRLLTVKLQSLILQNVPLKEFDLLNFGRSVDMVQLSLDHVGMRREWLVHLLPLKHLVYLGLINDHQKFDWVAPLRPFKYLKELIITDGNLSMKQQDALHNQLRNDLKDPKRTDSLYIRARPIADVVSPL